jgi:excisionase family DNA binding protein
MEHLSIRIRLDKTGRPEGPGLGEQPDERLIKMSAERPEILDLQKRHTCSVEEAAALLQIGRSTAYAAARDGTLPTVRLCHRILVPTAKLLELLGIEREA